MTTEEKFHAAVNVIRSLPKNGSYQPSNELMLRFYAYYKQSTEGPCTEAGTSKPAFWDIVGRAKHTAWAKLKNMPREEAMKRYVDELHRIVETMSYTDNVATFMQAGDQEVLDTLPMDDLELIAGDCLKHVRSQPGSPLASRPSTPDPRAISPATILQESDDEEFIDSMENDPESKHEQIIPNGVQMMNNKNDSITKAQQRSNGVANREPRSLKVDVSAEIDRTVAALQNDFRSLDSRVCVLEQALKNPPKSTRQKIKLLNLSPVLIAFLVIWPFVAIRITNRWNKKL